ncbi:putative phage protein (TIGR01671 family) [Paenibacillus jamilae]|nr:putative phage protein (TIGR01671 family) [Paenibacillus jamilae]
MSRPIKFRAWDKYNKKWIDRVLAGCNSDGTDYVCNLVWNDEVGDWMHFDEGCGDIVQYTGLKDRNGKEAYHKDIVDYEGFLYVIEWDEKNTGFYLAYIRDLDDPESEEHLKGSCITLSTIKSHILEPGKLLLGEDTP